MTADCKRIPNSFFKREVTKVAPDLLGKILVRRFDDGRIEKFIITETEAYRGGDDKACHANKGLTPRTKVMFDEGGLVYVYLIYGMYWMLNFVTGEVGDSSAVLVRGIEGISGPGRVGKALQLDKSFYGENLETSQRIWIEDSGNKPQFITAPRVGIDYAGEPWINKPWRYILKNNQC
ncbi:DNA-3-methyladenine glycosylase [Draconibacterium sp. IB214405]|uniref:DNA-3-methyladenine glycosylase n=1 Tax=Draconibacterium sp. IB214405 TaxID=3097352 RepID=UPI002A17114D|nr:DNA-3-methyladenine glycosylase [Draconibacterium sp. IB214405]MDX8338062.1 DNA-3-methyladenine glycosylase [Draconibacterium sp. IB214405]